MTLEISLNMDEDEMIHVPYLRINYRERTSAYISNTDSEAWVFF
jgi:hypothetical protein